MIWLALLMAMACYAYAKSSAEMYRQTHNHYRRPRIVRPATHAGRPLLFRARTAGRILQ